MLPSSKLLPAIVVAASLVLGLKVVSMATALPALAGPRAEGARIMASVADARIVLAEANAVPVQPPAPAPPKAAPPALGQPPPGAPLPAQPLSVQGVSLQGAAAPPTPVAVSPGPAAPSTADVPLASPDALKFRRSQVEERERKLVEREAVMVAADKRLSERINELTGLQARLRALEGGLKERDEANWAGMVKVYEGMRPKDAASIFNALDKPVLLEILDRMKPAKATPVIAAMEPEKARQATADLSAKRTRSTTVPN